MIDSNKHRRSIRLKDYDYTTAGAYFITIVTHGRKILFGEVTDGVIRLNDAGRMIQSVWDELAEHYAGVQHDAFVVMPNHIHGVVSLVGAGPRARPSVKGQPQGVAPTEDTSAMSVPDVVHRFKTLTTKRYIDGVKNSGWAAFTHRFWQRNYFEHVIRDEQSLQRIRQYILDNPARWEFDRENPSAMQPEAIDAWQNG
jgi:REP element-mobilizing transposase RayT